MSAAAQLMFERGVASTSLGDVQKAASVSGSQLYHYFGDKGSLTRAVIAHQSEAVLAGQQPWLSQLDSFEGLWAWRDLLIDAQTKRGCRGGCEIGSLASELAASDPDARADLAATFTQWIGAIRDGLTAMQERGELASDADVDQLSTALLAAAEGGLLLAQTMRSVAPMRAAVDTVIDRIASLSVLFR